jgi:metallo-beta-lactamase family protein
MQIMLRDAAKLQEEEALFAFKQGYSKHANPEPLFNTLDAEKVLTMVESHPMNKVFNVMRGVTATFKNSGHILGAAFIELNLLGSNQEKRIIFSGDLGRNEDPIMLPPQFPTEADVVLVESTYGNRLNPMDKVEEDLAHVINEAYARGGAIIIPAFAVGRTQSLIYYLHKLMEAKAIPTLSVFIDSPMAINVTQLYERHSSYHRIDVKNEKGKLISIFDSPNIHFCNTRESSKALNDMKNPMIIISASGMATGGRILHHLFHRLGRESDTVLFAGYQGEGTRGRRLLNGEPFIKIFGEEVAVKCQVREINGLSAHGDQLDLLNWLGHLKKAPKITFITHGEIESAQALSEKIIQKNWNVKIPEYLESVELFNSI